MAHSRRAAMSVVRARLGVKRTWRGHRQNDANDSKRSSPRCGIGDSRFSARAQAWRALLIDRPASPFRSNIGCSAFNNRRPFFVDMRTCRTHKAPRTSFHSHPPKIPGSSRYCISTPPPLVFGRSKEILTALFVETRMFHPHKAADTYSGIRPLIVAGRSQNAPQMKKRSRR
jgi:hypothetical protein